jgi:hypothetical protein
MNETLRKLQAANPKLNILPIDAPAFERYGRLLKGYNARAVITRAKAILPATERVAYEPSVAALEKPAKFNTAMMNEVFGGMPIQVGWCYGKNLQMAALEYHKGSEVNVCLTDVILLVAHVQDIVWGEQVTLDTSKVAAFYAPAGSVVELSPWNLHYAPIHVQEGGSFATLVYLPKGTNEKMAFEVEKVGENRLLWAVNKWLIAHPGVTGLVAQGAYAGMVGEDIFVKPI